MRFLLGEDHVLDEDRRELHRGATLIPVEPQVFDLLLHLVRNRGRVVTRDDLIEAVWGGRIVSESTLGSRINAARKAIGDSGEAQRAIRTIARRGFRFVGPAREAPPEEEHAPAPPLAAAAPSAAPRQDVTFCRGADGVTLAVATAGEGPVLVKTAHWLTHVERDWRSPIFAPLLIRLAPRHRLVRYDARGNGLSDREAADISFGAFLRDLETVVEAQRLDRFALYGVSQGAAVAIAYAALHPERVTRMVIQGGYAIGRNRRGREQERALAEAFLTMMRQGWGEEGSAFMQAFSAIYMPGASTERIRQWCEQQRASCSAEMAIRIRAACDDIDVTALLGRVQAPTLVMHSRADALVPLDEGRRIAAGIAGSRFVVLESDNHVVLPDDPAWPRLVEELEHFIAA